MMDKVKVLILDDEFDYCLLMESYFLSKGYEVFTAHNLKDGFDVIHKEKPGIVFLDNNLPDGEGWPFAEGLSKMYPDMHIHLISAYRQPSSFTLELPNVRVWEKPISVQALNNIF
jgi:DNA-binding NtrC family response regulator